MAYNVERKVRTAYAEKPVLTTQQTQYFYNECKKYRNTNS